MYFQRIYFQVAWYGARSVEKLTEANEVDNELVQKKSLGFWMVCDVMLDSIKSQEFLSLLFQWWWGAFVNKKQTNESWQSNAIIKQVE